MKTKQTIEVALLMVLIASVGYWLGYKHGRNSPPVTFNTPGKLVQAGLAYREDKNTVSQFSPAPASSPAITESKAFQALALQAAFANKFRTSEVFSPRQGIEAAERHNLYEMQIPAAS